MSLAGHQPSPCKTLGVIIAGLALSVPSTLADATNQVASGLNTPSAGLNAGASVLRMTGSFAIVMALLFGGVWLWKRSQNWQRGGRTSLLQVVETRSLGSRQSLAVVGYDRQRFLISCTPTGVTMLTTLPDDTSVPASPAEPVSAATPPLPSFAQALATAWERR